MNKYLSYRKPKLQNKLLKMLRCVLQPDVQKHRSIMTILRSRTVYEANKKTGCDNKDGSHIKSNRKGKARSKKLLQGTIDHIHNLMNNLDRKEREMV